MVKFKNIAGFPEKKARRAGSLRKEAPPLQKVVLKNANGGYIIAKTSVLPKIKKRDKSINFPKIAQIFALTPAIAIVMDFPYHSPQTQFTDFELDKIAKDGTVEYLLNRFSRIGLACFY